MQPSTRPSMRRAGMLAATALAGGILMTGCGGSSTNATATPGGTGTSTTRARATSTVSAASATGSSTTLGGGAASSGSPPPDAGSSALAFAKCMRVNGVPNFPDPIPGRGLLFNAAGINPAAPAVRAAQAKCRTLLPGGGPPGPGTITHPSAQTLAKLLRIARCMRDHGISQFPDPRTSIPLNTGGIDRITDFDGAILLYPATLNLQAPAYRQALAACGAPPLGLPH